MTAAAQQMESPGEDDIQDRLDGCLIFSLINVMLWGPTVWYTSAICYGLCLPALVSKSFRYSPWCWIGIAAAMSHMIVVGWATADNHKYVMTYWCLAIATALFVNQKHRIEVLATNACWILGLSMLFATIWKAISWEYMSGAFFEILFITDKRMASVIALATDVTPGQLVDNQERVKMMTDGYMKNLQPASQVLHTSFYVHLMAIAATWWTVLIEGLKGVLFLLPYRGQVLFFWRNLVLIIFCFSTYFLAPVPGFGCSLTSMGMATCLDRGKIWYRLYQAAYVYVFVTWVGADSFRKMLVEMMGRGGPGF